MRRRWRLVALATALLGFYALVTALFVLPDVRPPPWVDLASLSATACADPEFLEQVRRERRILFVPLAQIPSALITALLGQEDRLFRQHHGVDWTQMLKAIGKGVTAGEYRYGAGTITMQLMRELHLGTERRLLRKAREMAYALQLERRLSKDEILELYLNVVHWGVDIYGVGAAACYYFGVPPAALDAAQSEELVSLLPSPDRLGPALRQRSRPPRLLPPA